MYVSSGSHLVNSALPLAPDGLEYRPQSLNGQSYVTTGCFQPGATTRRLCDLQAVTVLVLDCDLAPWLARRQSWPETGDAAKARMYAGLAHRPEVLAKVKAAFRAEIEAAVAGLELQWLPAQATCIVDSGWGYHLYFWLDRPAVGEEEIRAMRLANKTLVGLLNDAVGYELADKGVHDTGTRILRVAGSENTKTTPAQPVAIVGGDPDARVSVGLARTLRVQSVKAKRAEKAEQAEKAKHPSPAPAEDEDEDAEGGRYASEPSSAPDADEDEDEAPESGMYEVEPSSAQRRAAWGYANWVAARSKSVRDAFAKAREEGKQSSEKDFALARALAQRRVDPVTIALLLDVTVRRDEKHDGTDYFQRTAEKAWTTLHGGVLDPEHNYTMSHPAAVLQITPGMTDARALVQVVQHDPRIMEMLWVDQRNYTIRWDASEQGQRRTRAFAAVHPLGPAADLEADSALAYAFSDVAAQRVCAMIEDCYGIATLAHWRDSAKLIVTALRQRNPVREYLTQCVRDLDTGDDGLLDGEPLLETWLIRAMGVADTAMNRLLSRKWLVGGAARGLNPGVFTKAMLVLTGGQSAGKTSMFRVLGGEHYGAAHSQQVGSKDAIMESHASWLVEFDEMDHMGKSTAEAIKSYITIQEDKIRLPYGSIVQTMPRSCFFAGTVNKPDMLTDPTGNDRYWCVALPKDARCDFDFVASQRDRIWGLAAREWLRVRQGSTTDRVLAVNLTRDELDLLRASNVAFERVDPIEDTLLAEIWWRGTHGENPERPVWAVTWPELMDLVGGKSLMEFTARGNDARIRAVLERRGFALKQARGQDGDRARRWCPPIEWLYAFQAGTLPTGVTQGMLDAIHDREEAEREAEANWKQA